MVKVKVDDVGDGPKHVDLLVESDFDAESAVWVELEFLAIPRSSDFFSSMRIFIKVIKFGILLKLIHFPL